MTQCKIHNVRFYNPEPQAIRCISLQESTKTIALSRSDASIEIWNLKKTWFVERTIAPTVENFSIEDIVWCGNKLLSVGLHGLLIEYNLSKLCIENRWAVTGEAAFCLDVNCDNSLIAIGTEQGYLNIFSVQQDGIFFKKFFDKQEGRIICLKFDSTGEFVVSGSIDAIRVWNVQSGHAVHKMTTGRAEANKPTIVWCLGVTDDFTVISGDSRGRLTFWDGKLGSQLESYQSHKADILTICISKNQTSLFCAGVDPSIVNYEKITVKDGMQKWVRSIQRKIHDHDVNALILLDNKLYSGGADSYLACSYHPPKTLLKMPPLLQNPCIHLSANANYILLRYSKHIEMWSLGKSRNTDSSFRGLLNLKEEPRKLLELKRITKNYENEEDGEGIICAAVSNNGKWIFYSTALGINLFQFVHDDETPSLIKVDDLENCEVPCNRAVFTPKNSQLITCTNAENINIYTLIDGRASISQIIDVSEIFDCITFFLISRCGKYLIVGDVVSNIVVFVCNMKTSEWKQHCRLPKYQFPPTAMNVHPITLNLVVVYSDFKAIEYDIVKKHYTEFSRTLERNDWKLRTYPIRNITFDPRSNHIIILQDDSNIIIINKNKKTKSTSEKSKLIKTDSILDKSFEETEINSIKKYKHLVHLEWLDEDEMVAVEINPLRIFEQLPPVFLQNTFGKK